jgi:outer membrane murein-binding lipoprotein Lpp
MSMKKLMTVSVAIMLSLMLLVLSGCNTQDKIDDAVAEALNAKQAEVDVQLTALNERIDALVATQTSLEASIAEKDEALKEAQGAIETLTAELEEALLEQEEIEQEATELSSGVYVETKGLTSNFSVTLDNVDYDKLYTSVVRYDRKDYIVDEVLTLTSDVKPKYDIEDKNAEIFVQLADSGAIIYRVEISDEITFVDGEYFPIKFLGKTIYLSNLSNGEATFYQGVKNFVKAGDSVEVDGAVITLVSVGDTRVLVEVTSNEVTQSATISEDSSRVIAGVDVHVSEIMKGTNDIAYATITAAVDGDVEYTIEDGDFYDANDDYRYVITDTSIGLRLDIDLTKYDEVLAVGDSIVLPNDYLKISFDSIKYAEVEDVEFDISGNDIRIYYEGIVRVDDGNRNRVVTDLRFNVENRTNITASYRISGERFSNINVSEITISVYNRDRVLTLNVLDGNITLGNYNLSYVKDGFTDLSVDSDDEDDIRLDNGDIVYKVDFEDEPIRVIIGLVSDRDLELVLKVE